MPERYFSIPVGNNAGLVELQAWVKSLLPMSEMVDPANLHITLVEAPVTSAEISVPSMPAFEVRVTEVEVVEDAGRFAIAAKIQPKPELTYLQTTLFYELYKRGVIAQQSWPNRYEPRVVVAYADERPEALALPVDLQLVAETVQLTAEGYEVVAGWLLEPSLSREPMREMAANSIMDVLTIGEFGGRYPEVPLFPGINMDELLTGDDNPFFVTLPVGEDDVTSRNGRFYSRAVVDVVEKQMRQKRPGALLGHLADSQADTAFPIFNAHWVGNMREGKVLWGKAYVPPGPTREFFRRMKALGAQVATSIYGTGKASYDAKREAWVVEPDSFNLEQIDFAPADRAGVPSLARVPHITKEMVDDKEAKMPSDDVKAVDRLQVIRELTVQDVIALPEAVVAAVRETAPERAKLAEITALVGERPLEAIAEMRVQLAEAVVDRVKLTVAELVKLESVRPIVERLVMAELKSADELHSMNRVRPVVEQVAGSDVITAMLESNVKEMMGPAQKRPGDTPVQATGMLLPKPVK